jgi:uncharacterized protein
MGPEAYDAAQHWIEATTATNQTIDLSFHGGEPLVAGVPWYERQLPRLRARFGDRLGLSLQSNLWLLDDAYCDLFKEYGVYLGTSLDGPEHVNDPQRGKGYFARTMSGIKTARRHGLRVGAICTFTRLTAPHYRQVFDFFAREDLDFSVHVALSALGADHHGGLPLSPREHADLFTALFDYYLDNITRARISTFDNMARGISANKGSICTFGLCLGDYLAIGPEGGIYPCNRFAHHPEWRLGRVQTLPSFETLAQSPVWRLLQEREQTVRQDCGDCSHFNYCQGGCAYNAITGGTDRRDFHCLAYKRVFSHIADRALDQVFSEENLEAVVRDGSNRNGMMRKGGLLQIMRGAPHPHKVAARAREVVAAVALATSANPHEAVEKLDLTGLITQPSRALKSLTVLQERLCAQPQGLVNAYLHVTSACNLACSHCYASSGPKGANPDMTVDDMSYLVRELASIGFRKVVITGGEPLVHPQGAALLDSLAELRAEANPLHTVLRTNLAHPLEPILMQKLARSTDQIVVSVDGDEVSHDARRGTGTYACTVANLRTLMDSLRYVQDAENVAEVRIAAVLPAEEIDGPAGDAVQALGDELGVRVRFKTVLPLGRGAGLRLSPDHYSSVEDDSAEAVAYFPRPGVTCGLGMNLYVDPEGECFPCYALMSEGHYLGNALHYSLSTILERNDAYRCITVNSNRQCRFCALRYLCGGFCRAWGVTADPDDPPIDCTALYQRAQSMLRGALEALGASADSFSTLSKPL